MQKKASKQAGIFFLEKQQTKKTNHLDHGLSFFRYLSADKMTSCTYVFSLIVVLSTTNQCNGALAKDFELIKNQIFRRIYMLLDVLIYCWFFL